MVRLGRSEEAERRRGTPADLLVIGLGNPGENFDGTRHNVGAEAVVRVAARYGEQLRKSKERSLVTEIRIGQKRVVLAFPQTFMNNSGEAVRALRKRYGIVDGEQMLVVHDELDLPVGRLKLKQGGGLAGHNGLRSITQHVGGGHFMRLRIGIGKPPPSQDVRDFVLKRPGKTERTILDTAISNASEAIELLVRDGLDATMNAVNRRGEESGPDATN
ncbi:MAG: aminoacyl-tRNA hydrolase [Acidimicrobiales bacterium]|nr:aminoacyl-tRNA hydrolase [Acidimicrobiales bacterium]